MQHLRHFKSIIKDGVIYYTDQEGTDFYAAQTQFKSETLKVLYDEKSGEIIANAVDVSLLSPEDDSSIIELDKSVSLVGKRFTDGVLTSYPPSQYHEWDGTQWVLNDKHHPTLLADKKAEKLKEINTKAQAFVSKVAGLDIVPDYEVKTWQTQGEEAKAWHADKSAVTPNLNAIAAARGIPADVLKAKAYEKTVKFELLTAVVAGLRQGYEDANNVAKTLEEVEKINPVYKLPEVNNE